MQLYEGNRLPEDQTAVIEIENLLGLVPSALYVDAIDGSAVPSSTWIQRWEVLPGDHAVTVHCYMPGNVGLPKEGHAQGGPGWDCALLTVSFMAEAGQEYTIKHDFDLYGGKWWAWVEGSDGPVSATETGLLERL